METAGYRGAQCVGKTRDSSRRALRIAAVSPTVMSGSRREPLPAAPYCLLPDGCSLTASASRSDDGRVPQSFRSSRLRLFELERWLGQTPAAAQEGISGDGIVDLYFDRPGMKFVVVVQRVVVRGAVSNGYIGRAGNPRSSTKRGRQVRSCHPPRVQDQNNKPGPQTQHKLAEVLGPATRRLRVRSRTLKSLPVWKEYGVLRRQIGCATTDRS